MQSHYNIGKIVATFGVNGQVVVQHALGHKTAMQGVKVMLISIRKEEQLPYFVTDIKIKSETEVYVIFEDITTKEAAKKILNKQVWLLADDFVAHIAANSNLSLLGYTIYNGGEALSIIEEIIEQPHQLLAKITHQGLEKLIPLNEAFIVSIDKKNKAVVLDLPEGLLDIYS